MTPSNAYWPIFTTFGNNNPGDEDNKVPDLPREYRKFRVDALELCFALLSGTDIRRPAASLSDSG